LVARSFPDFEGWVYVGTKGSPRIYFYREFYSGELTIATTEELAELDFDESLTILLNEELWPDSDRYYLTLLGGFAYGNPTGVELDTLTVYQPPDASVPLYTVPCERTFDRPGYEWIFRFFAFEIPEPFDANKPFRWVVDYTYYDSGVIDREIIIDYGEEEK